MEASQVVPLRVGVIGVGNWAKHGHLRVLDLLPQYTLQAVYSHRREAAEAAAREYRITRVAGSIDELIDSADIDLVVVLNTAPQHAQTVKRVIAAGKHVYCEWPLTTTLAESKELLKLAKERGVRHVVGLQRRFAPHNRYVRDLIQQGYVGELRSVRMHVSMNYFQATRSRALEWTVPPENFSSVVSIYGGHFLDMLFSGTGWPVSIAALTPNQFPSVTIRETGASMPTSTPDQLVLAGMLNDHAVVSVHIEGGKRNGSGVQIDITGTEGDLRITNESAFGDVGDDYAIFGAHGDRQPLERLHVPQSYLRLPESGLPSAVLELAELYWEYAHDVANGTHAAPSFADAVQMHDLIDSAQRSFLSREFVQLNAGK
ncbi:Gfo/Idh/MocA family oxidoreductase [Burkholderia sp. Ac-20365]|uniref:Gfo/Idh/MocA family protein n=1 Tax=Burkholderia sp. Ac-20365 TaxID=2703897 RepID=UPI00197C7714|nr:Gfo/Idh/MocA family oxidoreductase [Burkholderia sp. Ac-20365]MBN3766593.1 Gfo/Idh/MocA family oxidoreductase [Burkholderia sp. Ac-20365]